MARTRRESTAPAKRDVYVGMLFFTVLSMAAGITVLALEADEYGWESQAKSGPTITLPAMPKPNLDSTPAPAPAPAPAPGMGVLPAPAAPLAGPLNAKPVALADSEPRPASSPLVPPVLPQLTPVVASPIPAPTTNRDPQPGFYLNVPAAPTTVQKVPQIGDPTLPPVK